MTATLIHAEPFEHAGRLLFWGDHAFKAEDWFDRATGTSWRNAPFSSAVLTYRIRSRRLPDGDEVVLGKVGADRVLLHVSELGAVIR